MAIFDQIWPLIEADTASTLEEKIPGFKYEFFTGKAICFVCFYFSGRCDFIAPTGKKLTVGQTRFFSGRYDFIAPTGNF